MAEESLPLCVRSVLSELAKIQVFVPLYWISLHGRLDMARDERLLQLGSVLCTVEQGRENLGQVTDTAVRRSCTDKF